METKKKILVVDDEEALCDGLGFNLEAEGYQVDMAYSAEEALALNLAAYDLILLDIMMGEISGTQLARIMKSNPATASVPIIFCTAKDTEEDMISGLVLGVVHPPKRIQILFHTKDWYCLPKTGLARLTEQR